MTAALDNLVQRLTAAGRITADDVLALRAEVYGAPAVSQEAIEALATLETSPGARGPEWTELLAEATVDFAVRQGEPPDYVEDQVADWLMRIFAGQVDASGLETLTRVLETAVAAPPRLAAFVLGKAKDALCTKGHLEAPDVALLRRLVFAGGGEGELAVTREEADALFDVLEAVRGAFNDAGWPDFFAETVGASMLAASPFQVESREAAAADEARLAAHESTAQFMAHMAAKPDVAGAVHEVLHPDDDGWNEWRDADAAFDAAEAQASAVSDEEAKWLIGRLSHGRLSEPERRLIAFLKAEASEVSSLLKPLLDACAAKPAVETAPVEAPAPSVLEPFPSAAPAEPPFEPAVVFGQRKTPAA